MQIQRVSLQAETKSETPANLLLHFTAVIPIDELKKELISRCWVNCFNIADVRLKDARNTSIFHAAAVRIHYQQQQLQNISTKGYRRGELAVLFMAQLPATLNHESWEYFFRMGIFKVVTVCWEFKMSWTWKAWNHFRGCKRKMSQRRFGTSLEPDGRHCRHRLGTP